MMISNSSLGFLLSASLSMLLCLNLSAQGDRAFVICEGAQDFYSGEVLQAPRLGVIDLDAEEMEFEELRIFDGHAFTTDLILSETGEELYVSAEDTVYRLAAEDGAILASQPLDGARRLFLSGDRVYVTRGDYDPVTFGSVPFDQYLVALDATDLTWQADWSADGGEGPGYAAEAMCVVGDVLHIGINNAFAYGEEVGIVGRLNLSTGEYSETDLGADGLNPVHVLSAAGGVVTVNARQYDGTSLSRVEPTGSAVTEVVADVTAGCGAAAIVGEEVVYQVYGEGDFRKADGATLASSGTWPGNGTSVYSMAVRPSGEVLLGNTDFATYGEVELRSGDGELLGSVATGIAPGVVRVAPATSAVPETPDAITEEVSRFDLLGRNVDANGSGLQVVLMSNGKAHLEWRSAD